MTNYSGDWNAVKMACGFIWLMTGLIFCTTLERGRNRFENKEYAINFYSL